MAGSICKNFPISENQIRILVLHHGQCSDPIQCDLTTTSLVLEKDVFDYWPEVVRFGAVTGMPYDDDQVKAVQNLKRLAIKIKESDCSKDGQESQKAEENGRTGPEENETQTHTYYEALSYTWGDVTVTTPIYVCGIELQVTLNLKSALQDLRCTEVDRNLWVDAVCINQKDPPERSHQVQIMTKIYQEAKGVLAWLGPGSPSIEKAVLVFENRAMDNHLHGDADEGEGNRPPNSHVEFTKSWAVSLLSIFDSPWWTRVWTYQEAMAGTRLDFVFGRCSIEVYKLYSGLLEHDRHRLEKCCQHSFNDIDDIEDRMAIICDLMADRFQFRAWIARDLSEIIHQNTFIRDLRVFTPENNPKKRILAMMVAHQHRACSDLRDKVYGFMGLDTGLDPGLLDADYTLEVHDVYAKFAFTHIVLSQTLDILSAQVGSSSGRLPKSTIFPRSEKYPRGANRTWVTDWSISSENSLRSSGSPVDRLEELDRFHASQSHCTNASLVGDCTLVVEGYIVDYITTVTKRRPRADFSYWESVLGLTDDSRLPYVLGGSLNGAFARMLFDLHRDPADVERLLTQLGINENAVSASPKVDSATDIVVSPLLSALIKNGMDQGLKHSAYRQAIFRSLFITSKGYIGLADKTVQVNDKVCILFGGKVPYILRKASEVVELDGVNHSTYRFLCDAYVEGLMQGEGIDLVQNKGITAEKVLIL